MIANGKAQARALGEYIDASPSPFHACREAARRLEEAGFERLAEADAWSRAVGRFYVQRGGSLVAWATHADHTPWSPFRIVGAHTDSPNLRVKPQPDTGRAGYRQLAVEVYGGVLLNSWLDRDLGLSGRAYVRSANGPEERLFFLDRPLLRIPQLAIHLHREIKTDGLLLNAQTHMAPVWGLEDGTERGFRDLLGQELGVKGTDVLSWDAMTHDVQPASLVGVKEEFLSAPRLDNLCSSHGALCALIARLADERPTESIPLITLFDHEEVGSTSSRGAQSPLLRDLIERSILLRDGGREDYHRSMAGSVCVSADMAHAIHPNYAERHEPGHHPHINQGPVIKVNTNLRYATEGETEALFQAACERADVPFQKFVNRSDLACGSTIGPLTAANLGIKSVDVGNPQLAMHSARELCGSADPDYFARALVAFWE